MRNSDGVRVHDENSVMGLDFTIRKSDGVRAHHEKKSDGVRAHHEKE